MTEQDFRALASKLRMQKVDQQAQEAGPHEETWWFDQGHPERLHLLYDVIWEKTLQKESEDGKGNKVYIKERCERFKQYIEDLEREKAKDEKRRNRIVRENQRLKELGRPPIKVPNPIKIDKQQYEAKLRQFEAQFMKH